MNLIKINILWSELSLIQQHFAQYHSLPVSDNNGKMALAERQEVTYAVSQNRAVISSNILNKCHSTLIILV